MHLPLFKVMLRAKKYDKIPKNAAFTMEMFAGIIINYQQRFANERFANVFKELLDEVGYIRFLETQNGEPQIAGAPYEECSGIIKRYPDLFSIKILKMVFGNI